MRARRRVLTATGAALALATTTAAPALAEWLVAATTSASTATARALAKVTGVAATGGTEAASISWAAETASGIVTGYRVLRYATATGGTGTAVCSTALTSTATGCTDTAAPAGVVYYGVGAVYTPGGAPAPVWSGPESTRGSATVLAAIVSPPSTPDLVTASDSGSSSTDNYTNVVQPTFTGTAPAGTTVRLLADGVVVGTQALGATATTWTITSSTLGNGVRSITATATTPLGSTSAASSALSVTIDTVAPVVVVTSVENAGPGKKKLSGTNGTLTGDLLAVSVTVMKGTTVVVSSVAAIVTGGTWVYTVSTTGPGTYVATATQTDLAGNVGTSASFSFGG